MSRTFVIGLGVISPIGNSVEESVESFRNYSSGINPSDYKTTLGERLPVGSVKLTNQELSSLLQASETLPRTALLGILAARQAIVDSEIDIEDVRIGLISGTTVGGMDKTENFLNNNENGRGKRLRRVIHHECGSISNLIAGAIGINGFVSTINTACSSSVNSIASGARMINHDLLDVVVAGGADSLSRFTLNGFNSLMILDKDLCRPFDNGRAGLNLGEGSGYVVLASERIVNKLKKEPYAMIAGFGNTNDAYHQTASSPEGTGSFAAMEAALRMAGVQTSEIDYINAHGTGTVNNDSSEGTAIKRLFKDIVPPFSSTKSFTGHTLGASGGVESVFSIAALNQGFMIPNLRFKTPIDELEITPCTKFTVDNMRHVLKNAFGFGGNCSSILFSKAT